MRMQKAKESEEKLTCALTSHDWQRIHHALLLNYQPGNTHPEEQKKGKEMLLPMSNMIRQDCKYKMKM